MTSVNSLGNLYSSYRRYTNNTDVRHSIPVQQGYLVQNVQNVQEIPNDEFVTIADETCTDGQDDGKISFWSKLGNTIKGIWNGAKNIVKAAVKNPIKTIAMIGVCCIPVIGPVVGAGLAAYGIAKGVSTIAQGVAIANSASSDAEAKLAWQNIGDGAFTTGVSIVGLKASAGALRGQLTGGSATVNAMRNHATLGEIGRTALAETGQNALNMCHAVKNKASNLWKNTKEFGTNLKSACQAPKGSRWSAVKDAFKGTNTYQKAAAKVNEAKTKAQDGYKKLQEKCDTSKIAERQQASQQAVQAKQQAAIEQGKLGEVTETYANGVPKQVKINGEIIKYNSNGDVVSVTKNGITRATNTKRGTTTETTTMRNADGKVTYNKTVKTNSKTGVTTVKETASNHGSRYYTRQNSNTHSSYTNARGNRTYVYNGQEVTGLADRALARIDSTKVGTFAQAGQGQLGRYYFGTLANSYTNK